MTQLLNFPSRPKSSSVVPHISLVGAGPGDPDLLTLKGLKALQSANVVLYDALIDTQLLEYCPQAVHIFVGKRANNHAMPQAEINELMVAKARQHGHVVRLKGGDPFIFGRGHEEMSYARSQGIDCQYIPGISSIQAAPGSFDIPLTSRGLSDGFWVITGTKTDGSLSEDLRQALQTSATVVILMGMNKLAQIAQICQELGKGELPAAIIQNGTTAQAQMGHGQAKNLPEIAEKNQLRNPAVIVLGEVVSLATTTPKQAAAWAAV
jgi:uroporphyrin-III C-methyltransferase